MSLSAAHASIMRCGWKTVAEMGDERFWCRKLEYGSKDDRNVPSMLNTLTVCLSDPLVRGCMSAEQHNSISRVLTSQKQERAHARRDCGAYP